MSLKISSFFLTVWLDRLHFIHSGLISAIKPAWMLTALVSATESNSESTGPDQRLAKLRRRRGAGKVEDMSLQWRSCKNMQVRLPWQWLLSWELLSTLVAGINQLYSTLYSALKSSLVSQVSTLVNPSRLLVSIIMVYQYSFVHSLAKEIVKLLWHLYLRALM